MTEKDKRNLIVQSGKRLVDQKLVQGTWGNISIRLTENTMLLTPSGMDYGRMKADDLVVMDINTMEYEGNNKPSSEKDLHAAIYRKRRDINGVIHSHPEYCSSVASARAEVPVMSPEMESLVGGTIRIAKYALPSTKGLAESSMKVMDGRNGCIMSNHGVIAFGKDLEQAFEVINIMEKSAKKFIEETVKKLAKVDEYSEDIMIKLFLKKYNK